MTLIDNTGTAAEDLWVYWREGDDLPDPDLAVAVRQAEWDAYAERSGTRARGIWIAASEGMSGLDAHLADVSLVVIEFPKSRDGRGFTLARSLRERYRFTGDIRAAGPLLPDQFAVLLQCGFTSLLVPQSVPLQRWREAAGALTARQSKPRTLLDRLARDGQV